MRRILFTGFCLFFSSLSFAKLDIKADLFEVGKNPEVKLFHLDQEVEGSDDGPQSMKAVFVDTDGKPVFSEDATMDNGKIIKNNINQLQTGEKASIEVKDGKVYFSLTAADGSVKSASENVREPLLVNASFANFVKKNWNRLVQNEVLEFRFAVWSRLETVGFEFKKIGNEGDGDSKLMLIKMKPTSFVIAALVDPLVFKYSYKDQRIVSYVGRVSPKRKSGSSWKDLDAHVKYTITEVSEKPVEVAPTPAPAAAKKSKKR